eukprot:4501614-Amphidinium_carterae.1
MYVLRVGHGGKIHCVEGAIQTIAEVLKKMTTRAKARVADDTGSATHTERKRRNDVVCTSAVKLQATPVTEPSVTQVTRKCKVKVASIGVYRQDVRVREWRYHRQGSANQLVNGERRGKEAV